MRESMAHQLAMAVPAPPSVITDASACPRCSGPTFYDDDELGRTVVRCWRRQTCRWVETVRRIKPAAAPDRICARCGKPVRARARCAECKAVYNRKYVTSSAPRIRARVA